MSIQTQPPASDLHLLSNPVQESAIETIDQQAKKPVTTSDVGKMEPFGEMGAVRNGKRLQTLSNENGNIRRMPTTAHNK